jgi:outer membrane lipoprotein-sorting protein
MVPVGVIGVVAVGALAPGASADLPARTPQQVLELAQQGAELDAYSGTVQVRTDLGIPAALLGGDTSPGGMATSGERTLRVWKDGEQRQRVSVATRMGEQTLVRDGDVVWAWDSGDATATRLALPDRGEKTPAWASGEPVDPGEAARWVLDAVGPTTQVSAGEPAVVAGREAYELALVPTQQGTLVARVALAVDAATGAVLRLQVSAVGAGEPAVDVAYTAFDPTTPSAEVFAFSPPPGSTVERADVPARGAAPKADGPRPDVVGTGWSTVVVLPAGAADDVAAELPAGVAQPVEGGSVVSTALVSVLLADDGRVLVGLVTPQVLSAAAGG